MNGDSVLIGNLLDWAKRNGKLPEMVRALYGDAVADDYYRPQPPRWSPELIEQTGQRMRDAINRSMGRPT